MWFVVALPIFLYDNNWGFSRPSFLALWAVGYGVVQSCVPTFIKSSNDGLSNEVKAASLDNRAFFGNGYIGFIVESQLRCKQDCYAWSSRLWALLCH